MNDKVQKLLDQWKLAVGIVLGALGEAYEVFSKAWEALVSVF